MLWQMGDMCLYSVTHTSLFLLYYNYIILYYIVLYRVSINSFPGYKHLLRESYVEYKYIYIYIYIQNLTQLKKFFLETNLSNVKHNMFVFHVFFL